ncbi:response regulator [Pelomonas sp. KK5]|uniref:hybrid sensor histidine kinase/response regulator n=1 Tax=Pelomonas sp. KK5 TaxID=1855730 RepID=UPI00097C8A1B|nr:response regulator [Pelomonas sp. KK5]
MALNSDFMALMLETFSTELGDQLQRITDGLLRLEKDAQSEPRRSDTLNEIFRAAHNVKGAARGVDALEVAELSHWLESLFMAWRAGRLALTPATIDLSLRTLDHIREAAAAAREERPPAYDKASLLQQLEAAAEAAQAAPAAPPPPNPEPTEQRSEPRAETPDAIRVPAARLQRVSALTEELQVAKIAMAEHFAATQGLNRQIARLEQRLQALRPLLRSTVGARPVPRHAIFTPEQLAELNEGLRDLGDLRATAGALGKSMRRTSSRMAILTGSLQGDVRMLQLVPISATLRPMARLVRDLARQLGKAARLEVSGDHIELDRSVIDSVRDPLMHLLRNAVDHGIEPAAERRAAGKPEEATIALSVASAGGQIRIVVQDDGRGIDAEAVAAAALARRLVLAEELAQMSPQDQLELIFRPGFSTRETVSELSGRGVGLDVVAVNVRQLGGAVRVDTLPGRGTGFTLTVPLTLATERGLHVRAGREDMVIPSIAVERILEIDAAQVIDVAGSQAILVGGRAVALRNLAATLALPPRVVGRSERIPVVIVSKGWTQVAFVVDEVAGEREIVVKRLLPPLRAVPHISGATLTGSGEIMMVLNVADLVDSAQRQAGRTGFASADAPAAPAPAAPAGPPHILIVDDSITTRTLEKGILEARGYRVSIAVDGARGWELLQQDRFDLVITDIEMPVMNGFELTERIRRTPQTAQIPVIVVTSLARDEDRRRGIEVGADAYIVKGAFESQVLLDAVGQLI